MKRFVFVISLAIFFLLLGSCASPSPASQDLPVEIVKLTPYSTKTVTPTITVAPTMKSTATLAPTITSTPQIYIVKIRDTLFTIAASRGLTVADLTAANPGVSAYSLPIGTKLFIPASSGNLNTRLAPTPTPSPLIVHPPKCKPSLTGGYYCYALVENREEYDVENLTGKFQLFDPKTGDVLMQDTYLPLTRLKMDNTLPFFAYFAPPVFEQPEAKFQLLSAMQVSADNKSISSLDFTGLEVEYSDGGSSAEVSGIARFTAAAQTAKLIRIVAVAFDAANNVVGLRRYEELSGLKSGADFEFRIIVYSTGEKIDRVEIFGEAQP